MRASNGCVADDLTAAEEVRDCLRRVQHPCFNRLVGRLRGGAERRAYNADT